MDFRNLCPPRSKQRSWRWCLADAFEEEYGPLADPVATFGSELVQAPSTPVMSSSMAGPDPMFISGIQLRLEGLEDPPSLKCLQKSHRAVSLSPLSSSDTDVDPDTAWSAFKAYAIMLLERAAQKRKLREQDSMARAPPRKRRRSDQNGSAEPDHDATLKSTSPARPERGMRRSTWRQNLHGPPQTRSPAPLVGPVSTPSSTESQSPPVGSPPHKRQWRRIRFRRASGPAKTEMPPG
ncbi:Uncharacterized protein TCAP_00413 [Tolypocladium capitatum]|uniref:Uncharacterized protein n=1 Tax=Tolypocladium capitatum TaxID=45235 RepID=A0A2K3QQ77_9HYPO|nr:Uncharacterized protein TCAP_00413 [Tolypocladium capitatum]